MLTIRTMSAAQAVLLSALSVAACSSDDGDKGTGTGTVGVVTTAGSTASPVGSLAGSGVSTGQPSGTPGVSGAPAANGGIAGSTARPPTSPGMTTPPPTTPPPTTPPGTPPPTTPPATPPPASAPGMTPWNTTGKTCLMPGSGKFGEPGPYKVGRMSLDLGMIAANQNSGMFTIFYPMPLEAACLHPIVAWGNGTGVGDADTYAFFNSNAASWGMVVIASHESNTGSGAFHKAGIDYMLKQNDDSKSMFYKKLAVTRVGTSGHSQGAGGAVAGASHPAVSVNVGVGGPATTAAKYASLCLTGTEDIASTSCPALPDRAQGPMFAASWNGGDHVTTETLAGYITKDPGSLAMQRLYAAWFRCYLADDSVACDLFKGAAPDQCGLCKEKMNWAVLKSKNIQ
jgi:hypothetical protein